MIYCFCKWQRSFGRSLCSIISFSALILHIHLPRLQRQGNAAVLFFIKESLGRKWFSRWIHSAVIKGNAHPLWFIVWRWHEIIIGLKPCFINSWWFWKNFKINNEIITEKFHHVIIIKFLSYGIENVYQDLLCIDLLALKKEFKDVRSLIWYYINMFSNFCVSRI